MKYALCVGDGMADFPLAELGGKTPLEYARTPNMDTVASRGCVGRVRTVPEGLPPGSDVANMSLLGYDAAQYYQGRAPIEAASMGVELSQNETAFRCNLVTLYDGVMADYSAGHIATDIARDLLTLLQAEAGDSRVRFYPGISYRHLVVITDFPSGALFCTPPHDITGKKWAEYVPQGAGSGELLDLMNKSRGVLGEAAANKRSVEAGKPAATDIWLWGHGHAVSLPSLLKRFGISGSVVSAVDLVQGLGVLAGLSVRKVRGATGYLGTNYAGKIAASYEALKEQDFVFLHVEAPDETSHEGDVQKKITAIEEFDRNIVGEMLMLGDNEFADLRLMVAPDHATPVSTKTHDASPVPFALCGPGVKPDGSTGYCEKQSALKPVISAVSLFETFIKGEF